MAQERFWNWRDDDLTFRLNHWLLGIHESGLYRGFDANLSPGLILELNHNVTGYKKISETKNESSDIGIYITPQGIVINEDESITLPIDLNNTSTDRYDLIVATHEYSRIEGGLSASYVVIKGDTAGNIPIVADSSTDIVLGILRMPANTSSLASAEYLRSEVPDFSGVGDKYIRKYNGVLGSNLDAANFKLENLADPTNPQDAVNKRTLDQAIIDAIAPPTATTSTRGIVELATQSEANSGTPDKVITADVLHNRLSTESRAGLIEIATNNEVLAALSSVLAVTPASLLNFLTTGNYVQDANYVHTDNNFTNALLTKLNSIQTGAEVNVQSDWNESNVSADDYIRNKPTIPNDLFFDGSTLFLRRNGVNIDSVSLASLGIDILVVDGTRTLTNQVSTADGAIGNNWNANYTDIAIPSGYFSWNLVGFLPTIRWLGFAGDVDGNDLIFCRWRIENSTTIRVIANNSENDKNTSINYVAIYIK